MLYRDQVGSATLNELRRYRTPDGGTDTRALASEKARDKRLAIIIIVGLAILVFLLVCAVFGVSFAGKRIVSLFCEKMLVSNPLLPAAQLAKDYSVYGGGALVSSRDPSNPVGMQGVLSETRDPRFDAATTMLDLVGVDQLVVLFPDGAVQDFRVQGEELKAIFGKEHLLNVQF